MLSLIVSWYCFRSSFIHVTSPLSAGRIRMFSSKVVFSMLFVIKFFFGGRAFRNILEFFLRIISACSSVCMVFPDSLCYYLILRNFLEGHCKISLFARTICSSMKCLWGGYFQRENQCPYGFNWIISKQISVKINIFPSLHM